MSETQDPLKSPMLIVVLVVLIVITVVNFFTNKSGSEIQNDAVKDAIETYIEDNPDKLAAANVEHIVREFIAENQAQILQRITQKPQQEEIERIVVQLIANNPQLIIESVENWQKRQVVEQRARNKRNLAEKREAILDNPDTPIAGNPDGDITIAEFFDYNCGYCKRLTPVINQLIAEDDQVKVALKEYPILSVASDRAAKAAIAVHRIAPSKYFDYHLALMQHTGDKNQAALIQIAVGMGIDPDELAQRMEDPEIADYLNKIRELAQSVGITGTPSLVVGETLIPGATSLEELKRVIAEERNKK